MGTLPTDKELLLMIFIFKNGNSISAFQKNKIFSSYPATFTSLKHLCNKGFVKKYQNEISENKYSLTTKGWNFLVVLGHIDFAKLKIRL